MAPKMRICGIPNPDKPHEEFGGCGELLLEHVHFRRNGAGRGYRPICKECEGERRKAKALGYGPDLLSWEMESWRADRPLATMLQAMRRHPLAKLKAELVGFWPSTAEEYAAWLGVETVSRAEYAGRDAALRDRNVIHQEAAEAAARLLQPV